MDCGSSSARKGGALTDQFFERPILNSPYDHPRGTGSWTTAVSRPSESSRPGAGRSSSPRSLSQRSARARESRRHWCSTRARGSRASEQQYDHTAIIKRCGRTSTVARPFQPRRLAGHAGDGAAAAALAAPCVQQRPAVLLPGRSRRDGHLADRGRAATGQGRRNILDHLASANNDANPD